MEVVEENQKWCERLYEDKAAQLLLYGRALGLGHGEAEDLLQETFISLLKLRNLHSNQSITFIALSATSALITDQGLWRRLTREFESLRWFEGFS